MKNRQLFDALTRRIEQKSGLDDTPDDSIPAFGTKAFKSWRLLYFVQALSNGQKSSRLKKPGKILYLPLKTFLPEFIFLNLCLL